MIGSQDLLIALAIGLFLFGAKKLPELARGLGESLKEFKKATTSDPDPEAPPPPGTSLAPSASPTRACVTCQMRLDADWTHCPRCGAPAPASGSPAPGQPLHPLEGTPADRHDAASGPPAGVPRTGPAS